MDLAAKLLSTTNDTILDIALKSGYKSPGKFSSNFKTEFNLLPSDYRKIKKQNNQK
jgi:AraC-like DNA-binding protein